MFPAPIHHKHTSNTPSHNKSDSNTSSAQILLAITDDTTWNNEMKTLFLDTSLHTIIPLPDDNSEGGDSSIEQQLSTLEKESNDFFESLEKKERPIPQEKGSDEQHDGSSSVSHNASGRDTTMPHEECCDITLGTKESTMSSRSDDIVQSFCFNTEHDLLSETEEQGSTKQEEGFFSKLASTNHSSKVFRFVDATKSGHEHNEKISPLNTVLVHSFVKEYEIRAKDLRTCMSRTKVSRSKVAKVKQYLKKRYRQKCSSSRSNKLEGIEAVPDSTKTSNGQPSSLQELFTSHQM